eukprot:m.260170 g.260170  ORF g.260170 m.260170 type:complete len:638 (+) comp39337_c0_seq1:57-1970(+)
MATVMRALGQSVRWHQQPVLRHVKSSHKLSRISQFKRCLATAPKQATANKPNLIAIGMGAPLVIFVAYQALFGGDKKQPIPTPVKIVEPPSPAPVTSDTAQENAKSPSPSIVTATTPANVQVSANKDDVPIETVKDIVDPPMEKIKKPKPSTYKAKYVVIGTGTAAFFAHRGITESDPDAQILLIGEEDHLPYMRTPLSKELVYADNEQAEYSFTDWGGHQRSLFYEDANFYKPVDFVNTSEPGTALLLGRKVVDMNIHRKRLLLSDGTIVNYEKCLIATGGTPKNLPVFESATGEVQQHVNLYRGINDYDKLVKLVHSPSVDNLTIVGGGFLGSELAVALAHVGKKHGVTVTQIYKEGGNMAKVLPKYLSEWSTDKVKNEGVNILSHTKIDSVKTTDDASKIELTLSSGETLTTDQVIVAVGIEPNVELAKKARLEIDPIKGGILVNAELEARSDLWVAGDVASFYDVVLGRRREEHHDHAVVSGRLAGENMAGKQKYYTHRSMFWSDLGPDIGYEAIGIVDSKLPTVGVWAAATAKDTPVGAGLTPEARGSDETSLVADDSQSGVPASVSNESVTSNLNKYGKGVVFYMRDDAVVGVVLWNVFNKIPLARKIINSQKKFTDTTELARLFKIHSEE